MYLKHLEQDCCIIQVVRNFYINLEMDIHLSLVYYYNLD